MIVKLSDYVVKILVKNGVKNVFMVPGGLAMHLNDSFSKNASIECVINHHEQASAMAAEAYSRINNDMACVCTTAGPGATNAITGVLCAYQDSLPMIVISGQSRLGTMVCESGLRLRSRGIQECDICEMVKPITKYCSIIKDPKEIRYCMEKALYLAKNGRPGPCWIDIPLDIQGRNIELNNLISFNPYKEGYINQFDVNNEMLMKIVDKIKTSKRPMIFAGNGIRIGDAHNDFLEFVRKTRIPVVDGMSSVDAIETDNEMFVGRCGTTGTRAGNFAIQNCDLVISLGSRLNYNQTGFEVGHWARNAYKIVNDIDEQEIKKDNIGADLMIACDVRILLKKLNSLIKDITLPDFNNWIDICKTWKEKYPIVTKEERASEKANIYVLIEKLTEKIDKGINIVVSVGQSRIISSQVAKIKKGQRFITNATTASMGYGLPAAIGACIANNRKKTILITGEGSIQMNLQELQTIIQYKLPIVIVVINNGGYHTVKQTQKNYFNGNYIGIGPESNDLSFPDMKKIACAYGYKYYKCSKNKGISSFVNKIISSKELPVLSEVYVDPEQITIPKVSSRKLENGNMISSSLEDMAPFLSREEMKSNMLVSEIEKYIKK